MSHSINQISESDANLLQGQVNRDPKDFEDEIGKRMKQLRVGMREPPDSEDLKEIPHNCCEFILMFINNLLLFILLPFYLMSCWVVLEPNQAAVMTSFGKVRKVITDPGCNYNPLLNTQKLSTKVETMQIAGQSVPDQKGSPMNVSTIVNYKIVDPIKALYAVDNYSVYIYNQSLEVMRTACSRFPYRSNSQEPCLMTDSALIGHFMAELLQERCNICGVEIQKMEIMEVAYQPEVAQALLLVQQAQAKVDARKLIVKGSIEIVNGALEQLREKGIQMSEEEEHDLVRRLMIITCSDQGSAQPVLSV